MSETLMTLRGRAANNPELHLNTGRTPMCIFRIGVNHRYFDRAKSEWVDGRTEWYSVVTFGNLAMNTSFSIRRGEPVIVYGRFRTSEWQPKEGGPARLSLEIVASSVGHDLRLGSTRYSRTRYDETGKPVEAPSNLEAPSNNGRIDADTDSRAGREENGTDDSGMPAYEVVDPPADPQEGEVEAEDGELVAATNS